MQVGCVRSTSTGSLPVYETKRNFSALDTYIYITITATIKFKLYQIKGKYKFGGGGAYVVCALMYDLREK